MKDVNKFVTIIILIILIGCTTIPTQEMSDARQALKAANDVNAKHYAPTAWQQAQKNLKQAEEYLIKNQFQQAREQAILVKQQAVNAHNMAVAINRAINVWKNLTAMGYSNPRLNTLLNQIQQAAYKNDVKTTMVLANQFSDQGNSLLKQPQSRSSKKFLMNRH
jgi:predicted lipid-binding transport protein (Tim44 family)